MAAGDDAIKKLPVTLLTGFLGSGKTTLLNWILSADHGLKIAVIENEYGEIGIDDALVKKKFNSDEMIFEMNNGCICCTLRGDLIQIFKRLAKKAKKLDAVIIESTGMADPCPVAQTFVQSDEVKKFGYLDAVIGVVDAKHIHQHLESTNVKREAAAQIAFSDRILISKIDLVTPEELLAVKDRIRGMNPHAEMIDVNLLKGGVDLAKVLNCKLYDIQNSLNIDPDFLTQYEHHAESSSDEECDVPDCDDPEHAHGHGHGHGHGAKEDCDKPDCDDPEHAHGHGKKEDHGHGHGKKEEHGHGHGKKEEHGHGHGKKEDCDVPDCEDPEHAHGHGKKKKHGHGHGKKKKKHGHGHGGHGHVHKHHDDGIQTVGFKFVGEMDQQKMNKFLGGFLQTQGANIYRMKGILALKGMKEKFIFQGVHMIFDARPDVEWGPDEEKLNKFIFIGKDMNEKELRDQFMACLCE